MEPPEADAHLGAVKITALGKYPSAGVVGRTGWLIAAYGGATLVALNPMDIAPDARNDKKFWYLQNHRLFDQLSDDAVNGLCIISRYKEARRGEHIFFTEDTADRIFILKAGAVKIVQTDNEGNEVVKDVLGDHDLFGHLPTRNRASLSDEHAVALTDDVSICTFQRADFEEVLARNPQVSLKLATHIGDKLRALEQKYDSLVFKDVRARLLEFLNRYRDLFASERDAEGAVPNHLRQEDIAQLIGSTRQTVAELIGELEREGLISYSRKAILVR